MDELVNLVSTFSVIPGWITVDIAFFCCSNRFPFVACEIFTCEVDIILKTLVEDEEVKCLCCVTLFYVLKVK